MRVLILPLTKLPYREGRVGPRRLQDWYQGLVEAQRAWEMAPQGARHVLVLSNFRATGKYSEAEIYLQAIREDLAIGDLLVRELGFETVGQLRQVKRIRHEGRYEQLIVISTFPHYPRVRWICWREGIAAEHRIAFGLPRLRELFADPALAVIFPIIDVFGGAAWFVSRVRRRRRQGRY